MKKLFVFLFFIVGLFLLIGTNTSWLPFSQKNNQVEVTEKVNLINIDVSGVNTTIVPDETNNITAKYKGKGKVTIDKNGSTISVQYKPKNWFNFLSFFNKNSLTIYIPENYNRDLSIDSGSGSLSFSGLTNNKSMSLETCTIEMSSGRVDLSNLTTSHFQQKGSSGQIEINSITTKTGSFKMSSGNLDIKNYSGKVNATISSGRFQLQMEKLIDSIDVKISSGLATLNLPADADFKLNGKIGSGSINSAFPLTKSKEDRNKIEGIHGSGKYTIDVEVSSGRIELK